MKHPVLTTLFGISLAIGVFVFTFEKGPHAQPFLPIVHADGTKEFRLIDGGNDGQKGTPDDEVWVLRMPAGLWAKSLDEDRTDQQVEDNPNYPYNLNFSFIVGLPDFQFLKDPNKTDRHERLSVSINAPNLPYGAGAFAGERERSFSTRLDLFANYNCRQDTSVGTGVYRLRQPTDAEAAQMSRKYVSTLGKSALRLFLPPECNRPMLGGSQRPTFAIYDIDNTAIGYGGCTFKRASNTELSPNDNCSFRFWLPVEREVLMMLSAKNVPQLQDIYTQVATLLSAATDHANSSNMVAWETRK